MITRCLCYLLLVCALGGGVNGTAQTVLDYDSLVQKGKAQLQGGDAEIALATGEQAMKMNADRWEAYALMGGALMNLKRYEEAADKLSLAIARAPDAKQATLRDLRRECLSAESGVPPSQRVDTPAAATTQAEIVLWKSIENSMNPADFQTYLSQYPKGAFVGLAERHLSDLKTQIEKAQQAMRVHAEQEQQKELAEQTWIDPSTTLMWPKNEVNDDNHFRDAVSYCANLRLLSYSDWRLPTADELVRAYQQGSSWKPPTHNRGESLWTSTSGGRQDAHMVLLANGKLRSEKDKAMLGALCVRNSGANVHGTAVSEQ